MVIQNAEHGVGVSSDGANPIPEKTAAKETKSKTRGAQRRKCPETSKKPDTAYPSISTEAALRAAYGALLGREPDEDGFSHHISRLNQSGDFREILSILALRSPWRAASVI